MAAEELTKYTSGAARFGVIVKASRDEFCR